MIWFKMLKTLETNVIYATNLLEGVGFFQTATKVMHQDICEYRGQQEQNMSAEPHTFTQG